MTRQASVTASDLARSLKAIADAGLTVAEVIHEPRTVRLVLGQPVDRPAPGVDGLKPKEWPR